MKYILVLLAVLAYVWINYKNPVDKIKLDSVQEKHEVVRKRGVW